MPDHVLAFIAHHFEISLVDIDVPAIAEAADGDAVETGLEDGAVACFAQAHGLVGRGELILGCLRLGNVMGKRKHALGSSNFNQGRGEPHPEELAVLSPRENLHILDTEVLLQEILEL